MRSGTRDIQMHWIGQINQDYLKDYESKTKLKGVLPLILIFVHALIPLYNHTNRDKVIGINSRKKFFSEAGMPIAHL